MEDYVAEHGVACPGRDPEAMTASRARALLFAGNLKEAGGGCVVSAWTAQALVDDGYRLALYTWESPGLATIDRDCGTSLSDHPRVTVHEAPAWMRRWIARPPLPLALLRRMLLERWLRGIVARDDPDLVVATANETDLGRPAVQYLHYPWGYWPRPDVELRWFHLAPLVRLYRGAARLVGGFSAAGMAANTTLANSAWTADLYRRLYGLPVEVLYPPVPVPGKGLAWHEREDIVLAVGRIDPCKRLVEAVDIVRRLRQAGHDLRLVICGRPFDPAYVGEVTRAVAEAGPWAELQLDLDREALVALMARARYGLHTMIDEHFGIAVAEMVRMGCLTFVHDSGGARDIVADPRLCYATEEQAVARIAACRDDPSLGADLRQHLTRRAALYGTAPFVEGLIAACRRLRAATAR